MKYIVLRILKQKSGMFLKIIKINEIIYNIKKAINYRTTHIVPGTLFKH